MELLRNWKTVKLKEKSNTASMGKMQMYGDLEAQNNLSHMNLGAPTLLYPYVLLPVGVRTESCMGKMSGHPVVVQPKSRTTGHFEYRGESCLIPGLIRDWRDL